MIKEKITVIAKCDDCGATQKEQESSGSGFQGIYAKLYHEGWHIPEDVLRDNCYCPSCTEARGLSRGDE